MKEKMEKQTKSWYLKGLNIRFAGLNKQW